MYEKMVQTANPGLILILLDQSQSMEEAYSGSTKMNLATLAIRRCIYEIINACKSGEAIKNRCQIGVYGYGSGAASLLIGGWVSDVFHLKIGEESIPRKVSDGAGGLVDSPLILPIFRGLEPKAKGNTPMDLAFDEARNLIEKTWLPKFLDSFPPIVINITDGEPDDIPSATRSAKSLMSLKANDGNVLLFNAHISSANAGELSLPSSLPSSVASNKFVHFLFDISSEIPAPLYPRAEQAGLQPEPGARGCLYRADAELLTKMIVFGSNPMR